MSMTEKNILVVDDEELLRSSMAKFLERKGFSVTTAKSGNTAFEIIINQKIDLVLSDVRMPDGNGPSLLERISQLDDEKPVLMFITGCSDTTPEELIEMGAKHVFEKPVDRQEILNRIKEYFQIDT